MLRRISAVMLATALLAATGLDALACGDKFLRVGRSPRFRAYASVHRSAILVYAPRWTRHGIADFEQMLKRAGHRPVTVTTGDAMSRAFGGGKYDVVITSYADTSAVNKEIGALAAKPAVLPVLYKPTKEAAAEASSTYSSLLRPDKMSPFEALEELDRLIERHQKDANKPSAR